ncbi:MAG: cytochrome c [Deltaproteobacteria bacterium]|nr:cytochrome c [Deltaproteobacteria bacterium]
MTRHAVWLLAMVLSVGCGGSASDEAPPAPEAAAPTETAVPEPEVAPAPELTGDATAGRDAFVAYCSACHGPDAKGVKGLGKDLVTSQFVADNTDAQLLVYVKTGRPIDDPLNTTGIPMPPKGGNPALTDQEIADIIAYLRSIHAS